VPGDTPIQSRAWHSKICYSSLNENDPVFSDEMNEVLTFKATSSWPRLAHFRITHKFSSSPKPKIISTPRTHNPNPSKLYGHHLLARSQPIEMEANLPNSCLPSSSTPRQQYILHQTNQV
jgi:hypothetical protein